MQAFQFIVFSFKVVSLALYASCVCVGFFFFQYYRSAIVIVTPSFVCAFVHKTKEKVLGWLNSKSGNEKFEERHIYQSNVSL